RHRHRRPARVSCCPRDGGSGRGTGPRGGGGTRAGRRWRCRSAGARVCVGAPRGYGARRGGHARSVSRAALPSGHALVSCGGGGGGAGGLGGEGAGGGGIFVGGG